MVALSVALGPTEMAAALAVTLRREATELLDMLVARVLTRTGYGIMGIPCPHMLVPAASGAMTEGAGIAELVARVQGRRTISALITMKPVAVVVVAVVPPLVPGVGLGLGAQT